MDFPGHFVKGGALSEEYGVKEMAFPLVVVDVTEKVKADPHYAVTVQDLQDWRPSTGPSPMVPLWLCIPAGLSAGRT